MAFPERFELEPSARWLVLVAPWLMAALALLFAALPVLPNDGKPQNEAFLVGFAIFGCLGFGLGAWYSFKTMRRLPETAISVDEDGLWPTIKERSAALIKWSSIARLREREIMQCLEVLDSSGKTLARLEYQLGDFQRLRSLVLQRVNLDRTAVSASGVYQKPSWHHIFSIGSVIGFALSSWYVSHTQPLIGYVGMAVVAMIGWEYWTTPFRLCVTRHALEIERPYRRQRVPRERVSRIEIEDELINHAKHPRVTIHLVDESKPISLALGLPAVELHQVLQAWYQNDA